MNDHINMHPEGMSSAYDLGRVDPEVELATAEVELTDGTRSVRLAPTRLFIQSRPSLGLQFEGPVVNPSLAVLGGPLGTWEPTTLIVTELELRGSLPTAPAWSGTTGRRESQITVSGAAGVLEAPTRHLHEVRFLVPNFPAFVGEAIRYGRGLSRNRLVLIADGWELHLDGRHDVRELVSDLNGGTYAFTHVGRVARVDGTGFSSEAASTVLDGLHWFLSFVRGAWSGPLIADGYDSDGELCWRKWSVDRTDRWRGVFRWCDDFGFAAAQEAFKGFFTNWSEPFSNSVMRVAIGTYVTANSPDPVETAIITAQSGLELLGWLRFVESGTISARAWQDKQASDKIEELLAIANVDASIPPETPALSGLHPDWKTGPQVVAGVRNRLVHPRRREGGATSPGDVLADAWMLSSRYLELGLLHVLGVQSPIRNRLNPNVWTGAVAPPPWV